MTNNFLNTTFFLNNYLLLFLIMVYFKMINIVLKLLYELILLKNLIKEADKLTNYSLKIKIYINNINVFTYKRQERN